MSDEFTEISYQEGASSRDEMASLVSYVESQRGSGSEMGVGESEAGGSGVGEGEGLESGGNRSSGRWSVQDGQEGDGQEGQEGPEGQGSPADTVSSVPIIMYEDEFPVSLGKGPKG